MAKISKKKPLRVALQGSPYENLVQTIPDILYEVNATGKFTFLSDAIKNFGYQPQELMGKHFRCLIHPQDYEEISRKKVLPRYAGKITGDKLAPKLFDERRTGPRMTKNLAIRVMLKKVPKGGMPFRWVEVHSSGKWIKDSGQNVLCGSVGIMRDITTLKIAEDALKKERDNVRKYLDIAGVMMVALDKKGNITFINQRASQILGWPQEYLLGKNWFDDFIPQGQQKPVKKIFKAFIDAKASGADFIESPVINKLGQERIIAWQNSLVFDDQRHIIGTFSSGEDVTDRKRAQEEIEIFHRMTQDILGHSPFGILVVNIKGDVEYVNPVMADITGETFEQIKKTNLLKAEHFNKCGLSDYMDNLFIRGESFMMNYASIVSTAGKNFVVNIYGMLLKEKKDVKALLFFEDLSEIRRADEVIKAKDKAMDSSINAIVMADIDGVINYVNQTFLKMWGYYGADEVINRPLKDFAVDAAEIKKILNILHSANAWVGELSARRKDGSRFDAWVSANMVKDDSNNPIYMLLSFADISEKKKIEAQLLQSQKMETIGRLAGGVAHDFNNLLTAMMNYATLAKYRIQPQDAAQEDLDQIINVTKRAANLTHQLLSFSRRQIITLKPIEINEFMVNIEKMLRRLIPEDIELAMTLCAQRAYIKADIGQMEQVLVNLVVNARDAMPAGGKIFAFTDVVKFKEIYLCQDAQILPGEYVLLSVKDTGIGMSDEVREHLFEPFFTTKSVGKGTGLGLPTVYGIVKQHQGYIEVLSGLGAGTEIKIYIPRIYDTEGVGEYIADKNKNIPSGKETVFVVEDEPMVRDVIVRILKNLGYNVLKAADGVEALRLAKEYTGIVDILVTDMVMPQMNGKELAAGFRGIYPKVKVLFVSGYTDDLSITTDLDAHSAFLQKPFTNDVLAHKLRELLDKQ